MISGAVLHIKNKLFADITTIPEVLKPSYFPFMDGLRALAIISVILCHVFRESKWLIFIDGTIGVHLFFILSGFLITTLLLKEKIKYGNVSYKKFYVRRALRIFPVAYLFVLVLVLLNMVFKLGITSKSFLAAIFYMKNFPIGHDWYTGHFWTLSVEEQFYLFAPVLLIADTNKYIKLLLILLVAVPFCNYLAYHNIGIFYTNRIAHVAIYSFLAVFDRGALYILSGSFLAVLLFKRVVDLDKLYSKYYLSFLLLVVAAAVHFPYHDNYVLSYLSAMLFTVLILTVIAINLGKNNFLTGLLSNRILVKIGVLSYSLYIWQQIFTVYQPWKGYFKYSDSELLNIAALFIAAYLSYTFYESPFLKLKKRFAR